MVRDTLRRDKRTVLSSRSRNRLPRAHPMLKTLRIRNLVTIEALARTTAALTGTASDLTAPVRAGSGTVADPWLGDLP